MYPPLEDQSLRWSKPFSKVAWEKTEERGAEGMTGVVEGDIVIKRIRDGEVRLVVVGWVEKRRMEGKTTEGDG